MKNAWITSLEIAKKLGKEHITVQHEIEKLFVDIFQSGRMPSAYFAKSFLNDAEGNCQDFEYLCTEEGAHFYFQKSNP